MIPNENYFRDLTSRIHGEIDAFVATGKSIFATSSFQGQSLPLLKILSEREESVSVVLTNTGFLFPETVAFAQQTCRELGLHLIEVRPELPLSQQRGSNGQLLYIEDPDYCCELNKTKPLEPILQRFDVWINGIRRDQSAARSRLQKFETSKYGCIRYHPMLNWSAKDIFYFRKIFFLEDHPLEKVGYQSIGCQPCTFRTIAGANERNARWMGMNKTECGLNTDLIVSSND